MKRIPKRDELDELIIYWESCPRASSYLQEESLINFLRIFTPLQIKGAMFLATSKGRKAYFKYLCGVLYNWRKQVESGEEPDWIDISDTATWDGFDD